jgi:hypothetical protein
VSEEHIAFVIRVEERDEQKSTVKAGGQQRLAGFLLGLFFDPEDGGNMFLRNVYLFSTDYTAFNPRTQHSLTSQDV